MRILAYKFLISAFFISAAQASLFGVAKETENPYIIPVDRETTSEISKSEFAQITGKIYSHFFNRAFEEGRTMLLNLDWETPYLSAWANQEEPNYKVNFWGGFARLPMMTKEAWEFIVCHEIGHVIGGLPRLTLRTMTWASSEGQADHFAASDCLKSYYGKVDMAPLSRDKSTFEEVALCSKKMDEGEIAYNTCLKTLKGGRDFGHILVFMDHGEHLPDYTHSAPDIEETAINVYPSAQCRIDIIKEGALCDGKSASECKRSACWYKH